MQLELDGEAGEPADDLGQPAVAALALRKDERAVERAVGNRPGGEPRVDLVELLLAEVLDVVRRQLLELVQRQRKVVLDHGEVGLLRVGPRPAGANWIAGVGCSISLIASQPASWTSRPRRPRRQAREARAGERWLRDHDRVSYSVARKAMSAFLSASGRSSPKRCPSFSMSAVHEL